MSLQLIRIFQNDSFTSEAVVSVFNKTSGQVLTAERKRNESISAAYQGFPLVRIGLQTFFQLKNTERRVTGVFFGVCKSTKQG